MIREGDKLVRLRVVGKADKIFSVSATLTDVLCEIDGHQWSNSSRKMRSGDFERVFLNSVPAATAKSLVEAAKKEATARDVALYVSYPTTKGITVYRGKKLGIAA